MTAQDFGENQVCLLASTVEDLVNTCSGEVKFLREVRDADTICILGANQIISVAFEVVIVITPQGQRKRGVEPINNVTRSIADSVYGCVSKAP